MVKDSAFNGNWKDIGDESFSKEEILESDMHIASMGKYSKKVNVFKLYDEVIDKKTGQKAIIVYISDKLVDGSYLIEPLNHSYLPDWREGDQLIKYKNSTS